MARVPEPSPSAGELDFEQQLSRLEEIVQELETDALGLGAALDRYEEGMHLVRACLERLEKAQIRIQTLALE